MLDKTRELSIYACIFKKWKVEIGSGVQAKAEYFLVNDESPRKKICGKEGAHAKKRNEDIILGLMHKENT